MIISNDNALEIVGISTVKIKLYNDILCAMKDLKKILSIRKVDNIGSKMHTEGGIPKVVKGNLVVMKAKKNVKNLYVLLRDTLQETYAIVASIIQEVVMM